MSGRYGRDRVRRGLGHFLLGKGVSAASGFLAMVLVVRLLTIGEFADYSVLIAMIEVATALSGLGLAHALIRYVPELYAKHYNIALRNFVFGATALRSAALAVVILAIWIFAPQTGAVIGLQNAVYAFRLFLLVVLFRTTSHFLSQILESTLHQGFAQFAFSVSSLSRLGGMFYLLQGDSATLIDVIHVELISDILCMTVMFVGIVSVVSHPPEDSADTTDDRSWLKRNLRQILTFAASGYAQHLVGLPFGGNTNRLVGGNLFSEAVMASFGFAQSLYEYIKRYLPAQLLAGLIRPVIVARYAERRDFSAAALTCEGLILINLSLIGVIIVPLSISGNEVLTWVSGGKYGDDALIVLLALLVVLALETHRLILEILAQTVERYAFLIPSNILLSLSVLPAILLFQALGAAAFPLANAAALAIANFWLRQRLASAGFAYRHQWSPIVRLSIACIGAIGAGASVRIAGLHWASAMAVGEVLFVVVAWRLLGRRIFAFVRDLIGTA